MCEAETRSRTGRASKKGGAKKVRTQEAVDIPMPTIFRVLDNFGWRTRPDAAG